LDTISSVNTLSTGQMKLISRGSYGPTLPGTWELTIDPHADYIIREAIFKTDSLKRTILIVNTSGIISKDDIKLAKNGFFHSVGTHYEADIEVIDITKVIASNPLYEEVVSRVTSPLPRGAQIADCRGKETILTTVE